MDSYTSVTNQVGPSNKWYTSQLTPAQRLFADKFPETDFDFWVKYGSWSVCGACRSFFFNDKFFKERIYLHVSTSASPELMAAYRRTSPDHPVKHQAGCVGASSRWWYMPGMFKPLLHCGRCTPAVDRSEPGRFLASMRARTAAKMKASKKTVVESVEKTEDLYVIPYVLETGVKWFSASRQNQTWPKYVDGVFKYHTTGECMLSLTPEERGALQIIVLRTNVEVERYGGSHQFNYKKIGLSRAYFKDRLVCAESMPTAKSRAAFLWLYAHNEFYQVPRAASRPDISQIHVPRRLLFSRVLFGGRKPP